MNGLGWVGYSSGIISPPGLSVIPPGLPVRTWVLCYNSTTLTDGLSYFFCFFFIGILFLMVKHLFGIDFSRQGLNKLFRVLIRSVFV